MTHVSGDTHAGVTSSHDKKQTDKTDNQSEVLFDSLFSIVSELDPDSVEYLENELSKLSSIEPELRSKIRKTELFNDTNMSLEDAVVKESEETHNVNLIIAIEKLRSLLSYGNLHQKKEVSNSEIKGASNNIKVEHTSEIFEETEANNSIPSQSFSRKPLAYTNSNPNFLGIKSVSNITKGSEKLAKVVKLIEQAILSRVSNNTQPQNSTEKQSLNQVKITEGSAFDEAIEVLHELKNSKKTNVGLEGSISAKKKKTFLTSNKSLGSSNALNAENYKQTNLNQSGQSSLIKKISASEIKVGTSTRQVELSHQFSNNSTNPANAQAVALDPQMGDGTGKDGNENQQLTQQHRNSSPLSIIHKLNMADKAWKEALVRQVERQIKEGNKTLDITLNPKQLGKMTVSINLSGDDASIQISTETSAAASILLESEGKLAQMMQEIGLRLNLLQAGLSGKHEKDEKQDNNNEKRAQKNNEKLEDINEIETTNLENFDNSILNIVA